MLLTSITLQDIETLEEIHSILTEDGWVVPEWLIYLKIANAYEVSSRTIGRIRDGKSYKHVI